MTGTDRNKTIRAKTLVTVSMLCAIAFVAKLISNVIPIAIAGFLEFDLKDVIIVIAGFICGPMASVAISVIVSLIEMLTISGTGPIGLLMNIISSCSFACVAAVLYKKNRSMKGAIISLAVGIASMTAIMLLWNYLITPLYMGVDRETVAGMLLPVFLPFNLVKGGINATLTLLLYKPIVTALHRANLLAASPTSGKGSFKWELMLVSLVLLATFILLALVLAGVL